MAENFPEKLSMEEAFSKEKEPESKDISSEIDAEQARNILEIVGLDAEADAEILVGKIDSLQEKIASLEDEDQKKKASIKAFHVLKKVSARIAGAVALASVVGLPANHYRTRYETSQIETSEGIRYEHEDPETTKNLDYLLGKDVVPEKVRLEIYKSSLAEEYLAFGMDVPEDLATLSIEQIQEKHADFHQSVFGLNDDGKERLRANKEFEEATKFVEFNQGFYQVVWKMQADLGNPKIHFVFDEPGQKIKDLETKVRAGRPYYDPFSNTVYINPLERGESWLAEVAHAKQFSDNPLRAYALSVESGIRSVYHMATEAKTFRRAYDEHEYSTPGTLENEAHKILEAEIQQKMEKAYKEGDSES